MIPLLTIVSGQGTFTDMSDSARFTLTDGASGAVLNDYNDDNLIDIFLPNRGDTPNQFYQGIAPFCFLESASSLGVDYTVYSRGGVFGDIDNDGDQDLFVGGLYGYSRLYRKDHSGYTDITFSAGINIPEYVEGVLFLDYNNDGYLDIFAGLHSLSDHARLYSNNRDGTFTDISTIAGVAVTGYCWGVGCCDYNRDGFIDINLCMEDEYNCLLSNNGDSSFTDITFEAGLIDLSYTQCCTWADFNQDGYEDVYYSNERDPDILYRNNRDSTFADVSHLLDEDASGIKSRSCAFADYDNDGDQDLFVATFEANYLFNYENKPPGYYNCAELAGVQLGTHRNTGAAWGDFDRDGFLDLMVTGWGGHPNSLFRNNGNFNRWVSIKLIGLVSNQDAVGSRIEAFAPPFYNMQIIKNANGWCSQNSIEAEFGYPEDSRPAILGYLDSLKISWPSGIINTYYGVPLDTFLSYVEDTVLTSLSTSAIKPSFNTLLFPNPFNEQVHILLSEIPLNEHKETLLRIYNIDGKCVYNISTKLERKEIIWRAADRQGRPLPGGLYLLLIEHDAYAENHKLLYLP
ncbi:CRTAC1 family protein [bacterium]|nr:CRTAC1 family protein [bacterium]